MAHSDQESWIPIYFCKYGFLARRVVQGKLTQRQAYFPYPKPIGHVQPKPLVQPPGAGIALPPTSATTSAEQPDDLDDFPF